MESQILENLKERMKKSGQKKLTRMSGKERRTSRKVNISESLQIDGAMEIIDLDTSSDGDTMPFSYG